MVTNHLQGLGWSSKYEMILGWTCRNVFNLTKRNDFILHPWLLRVVFISLIQRNPLNLWTPKKLCCFAQIWDFFLSWRPYIQHLNISWCWILPVPQPACPRRAQKTLRTGSWGARCLGRDKVGFFPTILIPVRYHFPPFFLPNYEYNYGKRSYKKWISGDISVKWGKPPLSTRCFFTKILPNPKRKKGVQLVYSKMFFTGKKT